MFSPAFRSFVSKHITSIEQIEVLLLFLSDPHRTWRADEFSAELRSSRASIEKRIAGLLRGGLIEADPRGGCRYAASGKTHERVLELQKEYGSRRLRVIELVFSRADPALSFADAFRLKPEEDDDDGG